MRLLLLMLLAQTTSFGQNSDDTLRLNTERQDSILNSARIDFVHWPEAEFPGGVQALIMFIENNVNYPPQAIQNGVSGKVYCEI